jgi:hypothetical protein
VRDRERGIGFKNEHERYLYERYKEEIRWQVDREYDDDTGRSRDRGDDFGWER